MSGHRNQQGGFTILEALVVLTIGTLILTGTMEAFTGGHGLVKDSRARTQAKAEHRRNLIMLANTIRAADIREMTGFDTNGVATQPVIRRVSGADLSGRTHEPPETIRWMPKAQTVPGVEHPGAIYAFSGTDARLLADNVPKDTFSCEQRGSMIIVNLSTYYRTTDGRTITTSGPTAIQLRNQE